MKLKNNIYVLRPGFDSRSTQTDIKYQMAHENCAKSRAIQPFAASRQASATVVIFPYSESLSLQFLFFFFGGIFFVLVSFGNVYISRIRHFTMCLLRPYLQFYPAAVSAIVFIKYVNHFVATQIESENHQIEMK